MWSPKNTLFVRQKRIIDNLGGLKKKIIIYPFGHEGMLTKAILNKLFNIQEELIIDNYLSQSYESICGLKDLKELKTSDYIVLVASDRAEIYDELRQELYNYISQDQCFDILPKQIIFNEWKCPYSEVMTLNDYLFREATVDSAHYLSENMSSTPAFSSRFDLIDHILLNEIIDESGLVMEFGVFKGESINFISSLLSFKKVYGFDSFEGLPSNWTPGAGKGAFDLGGHAPKVNKNVELISGWFGETLPTFLESHKNELCTFIHIDCDLYSSTKDVLDNIGDRIVPGTIILFDEYFNRPGWRQHEYRAWQECVCKQGIRYEYLGYVSAHWDSCQVAVKVI